MPTAFVIDGVVVPEERAVVPVLDRGFLYGDGVYEVFRTSGRRPVDLPRHLERLAASAARIHMAPPARADLERWIALGLDAAGNDDSYVRLVVTRGGGPIGLDVALADGPRTVLIVAPLVLPSAEQYVCGVDLALVSVERTSPRALDPAVKSGNYLNNILGLAEAKKRGAYEGIFLNAAGQVAEGSTSNLWFGLGGRLVTPRLDAGILPGITRRRLLELAAADGVPVAERPIEPGELTSATEAFVSSSIRGVLPVARIDGRALPGAPGPMTTAMVAAYDRYLADVARGAAE